MRDPVPDGFLNLNKPLHMTSHDVVAAIRRRCRSSGSKVKVGHTGTLDPLADGVLIICVGAATRLSEYMMRGRKVYRARIGLGRTTTTFDAAGEVVAERDAGAITLADVNHALPQFLGEIRQLPPMYSAVKVAGKKLYELARAGQTVARPERLVTVHSIDIISWDAPVLELEIECAAGTYIRSLANDLGEALKVGAYLTGLTRTTSGTFHLDESLALDAVMQDDDWARHIISPFHALSSQTCVSLGANDARRVRQGGFIARRRDIRATTVFAFDCEQQLVAILEPRDERWKPRKVFPSRS